MSFVNGSGVRSPGFDLPNVTYPHDVTYQEAFTVRPFGNSLVTMSLTAQQIRDVLEQQFAGCNGANRRQSATDFTGTPRGLEQLGRAPCQKNRERDARADPRTGAAVDRIVANGKVPSPGKTYRVSIDNYLSAGKNHFTVFLQGKDVAGGPQDIDALVSYMKSTYLSPQRLFDPKDPQLGIPRIRKID